ncbi:hypothetical protein [Geobacter sp. AOG1]|uniref:hypothetical protein n=1 Tax=Geobacter sp. AOG1 TaxID=1566346 RepID=UPI001CC3D6E5|nr:hypothetical protein [Geobacter sp. AOG1]
MLIVLANYRVARLVTVLLVAYLLLLLNLAGIPVSRILPLVDGQRGGRRSRAAPPSVPAASALLPPTAPVLTPAGWCIRPPAAEVHRRLSVVAHGDTQDVQRHGIRVHKPPGAVVPGTRVPVIALENPVHPIVKEIVVIHPWSVVDRIFRHPDKFREQRQVDTDAHVG